MSVNGVGEMSGLQCIKEDVGTQRIFLHYVLAVLGLQMGYTKQIILVLG